MANPNFKIVCIVQNIAYRSEQGLSKTFSRVNNEFINKYLYTFNNDELSTVFGYDNNPKYLLISEDKVEGKDQLTGTDKWDILFVCDSIPFSDYDKLKFVFDENTILMYHTTPSISNQGTITEINDKKIKKGKRGKHEPYDADGYKRLLKLTESWKNGSFDKTKYAEAKQYIINWFGVNDKINAALEFLHNCLGDKIGNTKTLIDAGFDLDAKENGKPNYKELIDKLSNGGDKIAVLRDVRDALLTEGGVK